MKKTYSQQQLNNVSIDLNIDLLKKRILEICYMNIFENNDSQMNVLLVYCHFKLI